MHGLIVMHHLVEDVPVEVLLRGVASVGAATDSSRVQPLRQTGESAVVN